MPIPTRSLSLREPRKPKPSNLGCTGATKTVSTTTAVSSNPPTNGPDNAARNKSLLPVRDDGRPAGVSRLQQPQESRLPERGTKPVQKAQQQNGRSPEPNGIARRQSLIRRSPLRTTTSSSAKAPPVASTTPRRTTLAQGLSSPSKQDAEPQQNDRSTSPKKTNMPPPLRPVRSTSLRQPASSSTGAGSSATLRGHVRHRSQVTTSVPGQGSRKLESPSPSTTTLLTRANFTTYQQHFSPKKTMDKPVAAHQSGSPVGLDPSLIPSSRPEIAALQTELLQLSLLHQSALQQDAEWKTKVEGQLRTKYNSVAERYQRMIVEEKEYQRRLNGQALQGWLGNSREHNGQQRFAEQIQRFEGWFQQATEIKDFRLQQGRPSDHTVFIDPIDTAWKEEVYAMTMKLELSSRRLESLDILGYGEVERLNNSALLRMVKGLDEMIKLMVAELSVIRKIEADIMRSEKQWVSQLARQLIATKPPPQEKAPRLGMWRQASLKS
ncbi:uncharacterized protein ATNIH1004_010332 [Aspergillus tanneri]|uniref:Uncharacterized protein n=1 Tax=Aspergillus tanneri TaxID=1220188 RepID=A0A5M9MF05_9EURO|nr:uncharacterized protein ATNIH1004_010332 [Aspergillus tanneri]KAA8643563.1 hypothetical protein ATNIH1004_010332 [Aspergillus tanneri]